MSDNAKNGIIDLTEIVEMGTPPEKAAEPVSTGQSAVVDFDKELEDLFSSNDLSEFADFGEDTTMAASEPVIDTPADTPGDVQDVDDLLGDLAGSLPDFDIAPEPVSAEPVAPSVSTAPVTDTAPNLDSEIGDLLDSVDGADSNFGFDADFEDLLNDLSDSSSVPAAQKAEADGSDLDIELSSAPLDDTEAEKVQKAPEFSVTDESDSFLDDLAQELDSISLDAPVSVPAADVVVEPVAPKPERKPEPVAPSASASLGKASADNISLEDPFDVDSILNEFSEDVGTTPEPAPAASDDTFDLSGIDDLLNGPDDAAPRQDFTDADGESLPNEEVEMDDLGFLLSEIDEDGVEYTMPSSTGSSALEEPVVAAEPDPIVSSVVEAAPAVEPEPVVVPEAEEFVSDELPEVTAPEVSTAPAQPVDPSQFDADIDALLDDLEMAAGTTEPIIEKTEPEAAFENSDATSLEPEVPAEADPIEALLAEQAAKDASQEAAIAQKPPLDEASIEELLAEPVSESVVEATDPMFGEGDIASELEAFLQDEAETVEETPIEEVLSESVAEPASEPALESQQASPLGSPDEFESILDELDSLLEEQEATPADEPADHAETPVEDILADSMEDIPLAEESAASPEVSAPDLDLPDLSFEAASEPALDIPEPVDAFSEVPEEEPVSEPPVLSMEPETQVLPEVGDVLGEASTHEDDLGAALDKILGEEPIASSELPELVLEATEEEPIDLSHEDLEDMFEESETDSAPELPVVEKSVEREEDAETVQPEALFDAPESEVEPLSAPIEDVAQEALAELESIAAEVDMPAAGENEESDSSLDLNAINENAAPVPPDASIEDLIKQASIPSPEFSPEAVEILDTTPAVDSGVQHEQKMDEAPEPVMTPEEFAELTERIYYLENTLQHVVEQAEQQMQAVPTIEKSMLVAAIDDAFNLDGPLMARVLGAVEVRTESMIDSMGAKIEKQMRDAIEGAAAKSAAQIIREELQALLAEDNN